MTDVQQDEFRVLIVDDNRDAADSLRFLLKLWGCAAVVAYDGATALTTALASRPHCLVLDINMPGIDGYTLARKVRQHPVLGTAKLVALSARSGLEHERRAREAGFDYLLTKPADPGQMEELVAMLKQVMDLASRTEQLANQNVELAKETKGLLGEAKVELQEVKQEIREVKDELREVKEELRDVKEELRSEE